MCLENSGKKTKYSDDDLFNATIILQEVLSNKIFDNHYLKMKDSELSIMFEKTGTKLRQLILEATGVDTHDVAKKTNLL